MKRIVKILIFFICFFPFAKTVKADSAPPTKQTTFYFQQNGQPVTQPVKFSIKCYGTSILMNEKGSSEDNQLLLISETSESCPNYGCKLRTINIFEVYRKNTKYCNLEGEVSGQKFTIDKFINDNLSELSCQRADFTISIDNGYYKEISQYNDCKKNVYKEYYPQGNGQVKGDFLCAQYETDDKLIATTISTEPNGPCYRYGYTIKNNICYQIPKAFFDCTAEEDKKLKQCDQYLKDVTDKLAKDDNGYPFDEICEIKINIPTPSQSVEPTTTIQPPIEPPKSNNIFTSIIDFFRCLFRKISGKSC